jgi:Zn-dependent protease
MLELALLEIEMKWVEVALVIAFLVVSLGIHEAAHGWVALQRGDTTARDLGRITLNPIVHIDPVMTILLPLMLWFSTGGRIVFGGAKPVPVNFYNLRKPYRDMALVSLAGPVSNFLLALFFLLCVRLVVYDFGWLKQGLLGHRVLEQTVEFNLLLAAFNLLPIPPLDGSRVMTWLLPGPLREPYGRLEAFGLILVFAFIYAFPGGSEWVYDTASFMKGWIKWIVGMDGRS